MRPRSRLRSPLLPLASALALGGCVAHAPQPAPEVPATLAPIERGEQTPMALAEYRRISQEGEAARKLEDPAARVAALRAFIQAHPSHGETAAVAKRLVEDLEAAEPVDEEALLWALDARVAAEPEDAQLPSQLVETYHLKQKLRADHARRLLDEAARRQGAESVESRAEAETSDDRARINAMARSAAAQLELLRARVELQAGQAQAALEAVRRAHAHLDGLGPGVVLVGADGAQRQVLADGQRDEAHAIEAAAHLAAGDEPAARAALTGWLGLTSSVAARQIWVDTATALGIDTSPQGYVLPTAPLEAGDFEVPNLDGAPIRLSSLRGHPVIVTFWATWCGPCVEELPELQAIWKRHQDAGVELLAVTLEGREEEAKIRKFLEDHDLEIPVLLGEGDQKLTGYDHRGIPALYVIDAQGRLVHSAVGYDPQLADKLEPLLEELVEGEDASRRPILSVLAAPAGFGVRWQQEGGEQPRAIDICEADESHPAVVAALGSKQLLRFNASGEALPEIALTGFPRSFQVIDLDGDGAREWVIDTWRDLIVQDEDGARYWSWPLHGSSALAHARTLSSGGGELVLSDDGQLVALRTQPEPVWISPKPIEDMGTVQDEARRLYHIDGEVVREVLEDGSMQVAPVALPPGLTLVGRVYGSGWGEAWLLHGGFGSGAWEGIDLEGDGTKEIAVITRSGVVVYRPDGSVALSLVSPDHQVQVAFGALDDLPGDEIALHVEGYGLVVMGAGATSAPRE